MNKQERFELFLHAAKGTAPANFEREDVNAAVQEELRKLASNPYEFQKNRFEIFELLTSVVDAIVPKRVIAGLSHFAEISEIPQGSKKVFRRKVGRQRAKTFITRAAVAGVYEAFRLDSVEFEVPTYAYGGAAIIDYERLLDGTESLMDVMSVIQEGLVEVIFNEIHAALVAAKDSAMNTTKATNFHTDNTFDPAEMVKLQNVARAYGGEAIIFATPEFIASMGPDAIVPGGAGAFQGIFSPDDIDAIHKTGMIHMFRGSPVVPIQQSFTDETNTQKVITPNYAFVIPSGGEKVVKVLLEGATQMMLNQNRDWSYEIQFYKKLGTAILAFNNWCIYENTALV